MINEWHPFIFDVDFDMAEADGETLWNDYFVEMFDFFEENSDIIKIITYTNVDWRGINGISSSLVDSRIQINENIANRWIEKMNEPRYIHNGQEAYEAIDFTPESDN